ncbi:MAG: tetratricopeptide repeat protein [Planctomycetota bacterium]
MSGDSKRPTATERAIAHYRRNEWAEAERFAQSVVQAEAGPRETGVCRQLLGLIAHRAGRYSDAVEHFQLAISLQPGVPELRTGLCDAHTALARRLRKQSQLADAEHHAREALRWQPESPNSLSVLGVLLHEQDKLDEARQCFAKGVSGSPRHPQLRLNYANLLAAVQEQDAAIEQYRIAMELRPDDVRTLLSAAGVMSEVNRHKGAIQLLERAVQLAADNADVHFNLANAHAGAHEIAAAVRHYEHALRLRPDWRSARANWLRERAEICDWRDDWDREMQTLINNLSTAANEHEPLPLNVSQMPGLPIPRQLMRQAARRQTERYRQQSARQGMLGPSHSVAELARVRTDGDPHRPLANSATGGRLKIGYLSHDLRHHAIGHLTCGLFAHHDRSRFEVFTYSLGPDDGSEYRQRIVEGSEHFHDLGGWSDAQIVNRVVEDRVEVLIDVQGYSRDARPGVLLARPAPILIHYLGFPGTLGGLVDYFVTDPVLTPPGSPLRDEFEESLIYLPDTYQITDDRPTVSAREMTREQCGLPDAGFVFCAFNNNYKIQPGIFDVWMRILRAVPGSVLWLLSMHSAVADNLRREATRRGVDPARLVFADVVSKPDHLARLRLADLFLDTTVCGAHTTATDSLWAGVPVVTCPGERFTERVAASLLTAAGLQELIVDQLADYERLVIDLATDPVRCQRIRDEWACRRESSRLFATASRVRQLERAYETVWKRYCDGLEPTDVVIAPDAT